MKWNLSSKSLRHLEVMCDSVFLEESSAIIIFKKNNSQAKVAWAVATVCKAAEGKLDSFMTSTESVDRLANIHLKFK